jgi:hypothetical protein
MDEVGCNINMTKHDHVNGTKFVVDRKDKAKQKASKKEKHFTCHGLTLLTGEPIMCVVMVDAKNDDLLIQIGVDMECDTYTDANADGEDEDDVFLKNVGKGLLYPCDPMYVYEGKTIPCMVEFNPGGGITASIFSHNNGMRLFVLMDGHFTRVKVAHSQLIFVLGNHCVL